MTSEKTDGRQQYSAAMKARMVAECDEPGASLTKPAMARGIVKEHVRTPGFRRRI